MSSKLSTFLMTFLFYAVFFLLYHCPLETKQVAELLVVGTVGSIGVVLIQPIAERLVEKALEKKL